MKAWLSELLACPGCGGRLREKGSWLTCAACSTPYPVIADVPILVPSPLAYVAGYRDAILATLALDGGKRTDLRLVEEMAAAAPSVEPLAFGDDWAPGEKPVPPQPAGGSKFAAVFAGFLSSTEGHEPDGLLVEMLGALATVVELGCGAGRLTDRLARVAGRVVVSDLSLRAVLRARRGRGERAGVVADAEALPFRKGAIDALVAASLVDLLDRPDDFLSEVARVLSRRGRAAISTPEPALGGGEDSTLRLLAEEAGLRVRAELDGVPWIRPHDARYYQVYFAQLLLLGR